MRTFWDQVVALVEQGDSAHGDRKIRLGGRETMPPQTGARNAALKAQCEDIGRALDHLEQLTGLFQGFLPSVLQLMREFESCSCRLEEATARLAVLEEAYRDLAASHAATLEDRDRLAERTAALAESEARLGAETARCAGLEGRLAARMEPARTSALGPPRSPDASIEGGALPAAT